MKGNELENQVAQIKWEYHPGYKLYKPILDELQAEPKLERAALLGIEALRAIRGSYKFCSPDLYIDVYLSKNYSQDCKSFRKKIVESGEKMNRDWDANSHRTWADVRGENPALYLSFDSKITLLCTFTPLSGRTKPEAGLFVGVPWYNDLGKLHILSPYLLGTTVDLTGFEKLNKGI